MRRIGSFNFYLGPVGGRLARGVALKAERAMAERYGADAGVPAAGDELAIELEAYNRAFAELELPWQWDARTFLELLSVATDRDCVGVYVERKQPHLLRVYEKAFLRDLVSSARDRCRQEALTPVC